jgi:hypothetical protein
MTLTGLRCEYLHTVSDPNATRMPSSLWQWVARHRGRIFAAIVVIGVAAWILYFGPEHGPQHWDEVSTGWGRCGTAQQGLISWQYCYVNGTFRNDGGTGADRFLPASDGTYGDVYAFTALFKAGLSETCGAPLDAKTHHWQTVTVTCVIAGLDLTTFQQIPLDTTKPLQVVIQSEDFFQGMPSAQ